MDFGINEASNNPVPNLAACACLNKKRYLVLELGWPFLLKSQKLTDVRMYACMHVPGSRYVFIHIYNQSVRTHTEPKCDALGVERTSNTIGIFSRPIRSKAVKSSPRELCQRGLFGVLSSGEGMMTHFQLIYLYVWGIFTSVNLSQPDNTSPLEGISPPRVNAVDLLPLAGTSAATGSSPRSTVVAVLDGCEKC